MRRLVLASGNAHKLVELRELRGWVDQCKLYNTVLQGEQLLKASGVVSRHPDDIDAASRDIITRSHAAVRRRQRVVAALQAAGFIVALLMGGLGWWGWSNGQIAQAKALEASRNAEEARLNAEDAKSKEQLAKKNEARATEQEQKAVQSQQEAIANAVRADDEAKKALDALAQTEAARSAESEQRRAATEAAARATSARGRALDTLRLLAAQELTEDPARALPFIRSVETPSDLPGYLAMAWHLLQSPPSTLSRAAGGALINDRAVAFDPTYNQLAVVIGGAQPGVRLLRLDDGAVLPLAAPPTPLRPTTLAFRGDGGALWIGDETGAVFVWDLATPEAPLTLPGPIPSSPITSITFSDDGARVAVAAMNGSVTLRDPRAPAAAQATVPHPQPVWQALFTPSGDALITASADGRVRRYSLSAACVGSWQGEVCVQSIDVCVDTVPCSAIAAARASDGAGLLVAGAPQKVMRWDLIGDPVTLPFVGQVTRDTPTSLAARPGSAGLAVRTLRGGVVIIGASGGNVGLPVSLPEALAHVVTHLGWSDDGRLLVSTAADGPPRLWAIDEQGAVTGTWPLLGHGSSPTVFVSFDRQSRIITVGRDGGLRIWSGRAPAPVSVPLAGLTGRDVRRLGFDGEQLLVESASACLRFSPEGERLSSQPGACPGELSSGASQRVGDAVLTGQTDGDVAFKLPQGASFETVTLHAHTGAVKRVALRGDLGGVASAAADGPVRLWTFADLSDVSDRLARLAGPCALERDRSQYLGSLAADANTAPTSCTDGATP